MDPCIIKIPEDFVGATVDEVGAEGRFMVARPGDHLCASFQCPNCQSQNLRGKDLRLSWIQDACFESLCIRATLDAFWSRSTRTVLGHVREVDNLVNYGRALGINTVPPLGPFKLGNHNGMGEAIMLETRLLEKGNKKQNRTIQYGSARRIRSTSTVLWETSALGGSDVTFSSGRTSGRYIATINPSERRWYQLVNAGARVRVGDIVEQDRAYTIEIVLAVVQMYEDRFQELGYDIPLREMEAAMFFIISCYGGFRGYETVWTDLAALAYDLAYCEDNDDSSAVAWPVAGRFKNQRGRWGCYYIPIAGVTGSGVRIFEWTQRFVYRLRLEGRTSGWAFQREDGSRAFASDYADDIYTKLERLQDETNLIEDDCDVRNAFGMMRSGRRFFDTECINKGVSKTDIEFQCRWVADRAAGGRTVQRSMIHTYAEIRNMKKTLIRPSATI